MCGMCLAFMDLTFVVSVLPAAPIPQDNPVMASNFAEA